CRISTPEGPQVGDLNLWNRYDPRERFWAARTRQLQAAHLSPFDRLRSTLPFLRPLPPIVGDTLADYGTDPEGGRLHATLGPACPGGDLSAPMFGDGSEDAVDHCHPLQVTVYALPEDLLGDWTEPESPNYRGRHGLKPQTWASLH